MVVSARPASSTSSTALSPMSRNRSWRGAASFTNMSATRSSSAGHWPDEHCVRACFDALEQLDERADAYVAMRANFRAALHCGPVVIGQLGTIKMEIAFLGDTMNTAAHRPLRHRPVGPG